LPDWLNNIIAVLWMWFIIGSLIYYWWITIKNHWWFKKRIKYLRDKRIARKKRIANLKWEEKERYEKKRRDWIIIIICLSIVFAPWIIIGIFNLFWAGL
jgi:sterol desaturase/sphingolipid hydroxylase (fatty acid hydroxylase superfamily)